MTASRLIDNLQKMFDEAWEQNMSGNGTDLSRMVTTFVPMAIQELSAEEKHGRWIPLEYDGYADGSPVWDLWECSECQEEHSGDEDTLTPYCSNCGARMDGESE